jgi:hypothetical protein
VVEGGCADQSSYRGCLGEHGRRGGRLSFISQHAGLSQAPQMDQGGSFRSEGKENKKKGAVIAS